MKRGTRLASYLALSCIIVVVFASLYPFTGWRDPGVGTFSFLYASFPKHLLMGDALINLAGYVPLGFFLAQARMDRKAPVLFSLFSCSLLSLAMESTQMYLPERVASNLDWMANTAGGFAGALLGRRISGLPIVDIHLTMLKDSWLRPGPLGDAGIALLALWLFTQANPAIPLMGSWVPERGDLLQRLFMPHQFSLPEAVSISINLLSFGLVTTLCVREDKAGIFPVATALLLAVLVKSAMAGVLLKPSVFFTWANAEALIGVGAGLLPILFLRSLAPRIRAIAAALAMAAQILFPFLHPDAASPVTSLFLFDWKYGQIPTLNGTTSFLARLWPFLALAYLGLVYRKGL